MAPVSTQSGLWYGGSHSAGLNEVGQVGCIEIIGKATSNSARGKILLGCAGCAGEQAIHHSLSQGFELGRSFVR